MHELLSTREVISQSENLDDVLLHFGVKGMKWGVRKSTSGSSEKGTRREEKVKRLDAKAEGYRNASAGLRALPVDSKFKKALINAKVKKLDKKELQAVKDSKAKSEGKLTRNEKRLLIGGAIVATYAAYSIGSAAQSGELNRLAMKGEAFLKKNGTPSFKKNSDFAKEFTDPDLLHKTVANGINDHNAIGGKVNCRRATMAYEMRRRGNDVVATRTTNGSGQNHLGVFNSLNPNEKIVGGKVSMVRKMYAEQLDVEAGKRTSKPFTDFLKGEGAQKSFKDSKFLGETKVETEVYSHGIFKALGKEPNNARGELSMLWKGGGGHSVAWEVVNGKPIVMDIQTGKIFKDAIDFNDYGPNIKEAAFTRLDNKPLNEDFLMRWVKNAK